MLDKLLENPKLRRTRDFLRKVGIKNRSASLYDILVKLVDKIMVYDIDQRATSVAFGFTLAVFPAVIFLFTLIPYVPISGLDVRIMDFLEEVMPAGLYHEAEHTIREIVSRPRGDILSIGFILSLYASTNGMVSLMRSFNVLDEGKESRGFFKTRSIAILLTFLMVMVLCVTIVLLIVGDAIMSIFSDWAFLNETWIIFALNLSRYLITFIALALGISLIYRFAPDRKPTLPFFNGGTWVASALIILSTYGFSYYLSNFSSYNKLYGSIGTMIALMLWLYLIALLLIFGFEINSSIEQAEKKPSKKKN